MVLNLLAIGASRNVGYYTSIRLLATGATVTFLLRSTAVFDGDDAIQKYVKSGKVQLVKGDALVRDDLSRVWEAALKYGPVDYLLHTVGGTPKFKLTKGFVISPSNLVTQALINALSTMPKNTLNHTRVITLSSAGLTRASHDALPLPLKPLYSFLLTVPHEDKIGAERVIAHCAGWNWDAKADGAISDEVLSSDFVKTAGLPEPGSLKHVLVLRPAIFTDGDCLAEKDGGKAHKAKPAYRVSADDIGGWTISRKDVAHFVSEVILDRWDEFENKRITIAY